MYHMSHYHPAEAQKTVIMRKRHLNSYDAFQKLDPEKKQNRHLLKSKILLDIPVKFQRAIN